jgi:hypothetical protein
VKSLVSLCANLSAALSEAEFNGGQLGEILSNDVSAECVLCGTRITGEDMGRVALAEGKALPQDSKFDRLKRGLCARKGCISRHYRVHLRANPRLDWSKIREKASENESAQEAETGRKRTLVRVSLGIGLVLILLFCRYVMYYGHMPFSGKPHEYTVDPASVAPEPPR